jgi:hypothetical protein
MNVTRDSRPVTREEMERVMRADAERFRKLWNNLMEYQAQQFLAQKMPDPVTGHGPRATEHGN